MRNVVDIDDHESAAVIRIARAHRAILACPAGDFRSNHAFSSTARDSHGVVEVRSVLIEKIGNLLEFDEH